MQMGLHRRESGDVLTPPDIADGLLVSESGLICGARFFVW